MIIRFIYLNVLNINGDNKGKWDWEGAWKIIFKTLFKNWPRLHLYINPPGSRYAHRRSLAADGYVGPSKVPWLLFFCSSPRFTEIFFFGVQAEFALPCPSAAESSTPAALQRHQDTSELIQQGARYSQGWEYHHTLYLFHREGACSGSHHNESNTQLFAPRSSICWAFKEQEQHKMFVRVWSVQCCWQQHYLTNVPSKSDPFSLPRHAAHEPRPCEFFQPWSWRCRGVLMGKWWP